jgi:hypothetical protein
MTKLTNKELKEYLKICSSIDHNGNVHPRAILDSSGKPIPASVFKMLTGAWVIIDKYPDFSKSPQEREQVKKAMRLWKKEMEDFFGPNWRYISKKLKYRNVPDDDKVKEALKREVACLQ